jgi:glycosyltransferase involved in cell wall biosynthesis
LTTAVISDTIRPAMRLLCVLNGGVDHPSTRFRVLQHLDRLRAHGIEPETLVAKRDEGYGPLLLRRRAARCDAILIQKKLLSPWKLRLFPPSVPVAFDFDDAIFEVSPSEAARYGQDKAARRAAARRRRFTAVLGRAALVLAGNGFLAEHAARHAPGSAPPRIDLLPTGVDLSPFPEERVRAAAAARAASTGGPRIGWIGSRASLRYLAALAAPLRAACARVPGARLVQVCNDFLDLPGVPTEKVTWTAEREADDLLGFDVGLMPIDDRPFSRGKCGLKILQYQAAGVPVVCSPVGANRDIIEEGATGLFAAGDGEWAQAIVRLLTDRDRARRLAAAGRARVESVYSAERIGTRLAEALGDLPARPGRKGSGRRRVSATPRSAGDHPGRQPREGRGETEQDQRLLVPDHLRERPAVLPPGIGPK